MKNNSRGKIVAKVAVGVIGLIFAAICAVFVLIAVALGPYYDGSA